MFKKPILTHQPEPDHLISRMNQRGFKKGTQIEIPNGYELVCIETDGTTEVVKNTLLFKVNQPLELIYFVKSNRRIIRSNWGTPNRLKVMTQDGAKTIGGFGHVEFQLINPVRFITTRMHDDMSINEQVLTKLVLGNVTSMLREVLPAFEPIDMTQEAKVVNELNQVITGKFEKMLDDIGVSCKTLVIENVNFQSVEEGE